jgi:predicted AlkP superfamily pyrophosphatase or phosphodiesterase
MMAQGAWTLEARSVLPTVSAPNWLSLISGVPPAFHGYGANTVRPGFTPAVTDADGHYPNIITLLSEMIPACRTAVFYEWSGIGDIFPVSRADTAEHLSGLSSDHAKLQRILDYIGTLDAGGLSFTFVHFDGVDGAGHSEGYGSEGYYRMLHNIDGFIGEIKDAVSDAGLHNDSVFIICADHGGTGWGHSGDTPEEREVPLVLWGKGIESGPIDCEVDIYDIAPVIAALFGVSRPLVWVGKTL